MILRDQGIRQDRSRGGPMPKPKMAPVTTSGIFQTSVSRVLETVQRHTNHHLTNKDQLYHIRGHITHLDPKGVKLQVAQNSLILGYFCSILNTDHDGMFRKFLNRLWKCQITFFSEFKGSNHKLLGIRPSQASFVFFESSSEFLFFNQIFN